MRNVPYLLREITELGSYPEFATIEGFAPSDSPYIPEMDPGYIFAKRETEIIVMFLDNPRRDTLWIHGPKGAGKTTLPEQIAARLHWQAISLSVNERTDSADLLGMPVLINGSWHFVHGPLARAYRDGLIMIVNEAAQFDPNMTSFMHDVMEGKPLIIAQNGGEIIRRHPDFRLIMTANSGGRGDETGMYAGDKRMNSAFSDRCRFMKVDYPTKETEVKILARKLPELLQHFGSEYGLQMLQMIVEATNDIRQEYQKGSLPEPISTRTLLRLGEQLLFNYGAADTLGDALDASFTGAFEDELREAYIKVYRNRMGA